MRIDTNRQCIVFLTDYGREILQKFLKSRLQEVPEFCRHDLVVSYTPEETGEFSKSLWEIMHIFGEYLWMGNQNCFVDNEIEIK